MQFNSNTSERLRARKSLISVAVSAALLAATGVATAAPVVVHGTVAGSLFTAPVNSDDPTLSHASSTAASVYAGAKVCFDLNNNGACDANEPNALSKADGTFNLSSATSANVIAEVSTSATNGGAAVAQRVVLRAASQSIASKSPLLPATIAITPLTTEIVRMMENDGLSYSAAQGALGERIGVEADLVATVPSTVADATQKKAMLNESVVLTNRFTLAAKMVDRGDLGAAGTPMQMPEAQQASMNLEGIPRYDHIFIVMLENKSTVSINGSPYAPNITGYLATGNSFTNYFATGNPSEPNYTALGGADDFGITDDDQWNCFATGANAPLDPLPVNTVPGLQNSPFNPLSTPAQVSSACGTSNVNHNIKSHPNLFNALTASGMGWRTYNESTNPGQDFRTDSIADAAVTAMDHVYQPNTLNGNTVALGTSTLQLPMPAGLYKTKHNPAMAYQNVRSAVEFVSSNRTMGGGQWDANWQHASKYAIPANFDVDQFHTDLYTTGDIGALNYVIPDQCDDMHSITVTGTNTATGATGVAASDCSGVAGGNNPAPNDYRDAIIARGDNYVKYLVDEIQGSPIWKNTNKRVAIVLMFDEGSATASGTQAFPNVTTNSCCGWNPGNSTVAKPLIQDGSGNWVKDTSVTNYSNGNRGHGNSIFAVLTNQAGAPKGIKDSDAYSHFSFVRTLQDMFGVADPKVDASYMNRSKYTESFIAANLLNLPEYNGAVDTHYDAVRPMNHSFVIPQNYVEQQSVDGYSIVAGTFITGTDSSGNPIYAPGYQGRTGSTATTLPHNVGPDSNQTNVWALR